MARLPRLVLPGRAHYLIQRGLVGHAVFADAADRASYLRLLFEAADAEQVALHAYALLDSEVQLLATPTTAPGLGRLVQAVGRRYVSAHNRRHQRRGTLWSGRFRCAVLEDGPLRLSALQLIDGQSVGAAPTGGVSTSSVTTSAAHRLGGQRRSELIDPPEYWALGNTPFEREAAYRLLLERGLPPPIAAALRGAAMGGWALGSAAFAAQAELEAARPARPRPRGRPRGRR